MKKLYIVRQYSYGPYCFAADTKEEAIEVARAMNVREDEDEQCIAEVIYITAKGYGGLK